MRNITLLAIALGLLLVSCGRNKHTEKTQKCRKNWTRNSESFKCVQTNESHVVKPATTRDKAEELCSKYEVMGNSLYSDCITGFISNSAEQK